jgi:hypothetical protein
MTTPPKRPKCPKRSPQGATLPDPQSRIHGVCMTANAVAPNGTPLAATHGSFCFMESST